MRLMIEKSVIVKVIKKYKNCHSKTDMKGEYDKDSKTFYCDLDTFKATFHHEIKDKTKLNKNNNSSIESNLNGNGNYNSNQQQGEINTLTKHMDKIFI